MSITISHPSFILKGSVDLPLSKSESNRALMLQGLSNGLVRCGDLSDARDTRIMQMALVSGEMEVNIHDAGTAMRFLTAYFCVSCRHKILTGSNRMCERPIGILVNALRHLGFTIRYLKKEGFPPIEILPADLSAIKNKVSIAGNVSSQYISALMMIGPVLDQGLEITFTTPLTSRPYIDLTRTMMHEAGLQVSMTDHGIFIAHQAFINTKLIVGADWSAAAYWFSMAALSQQSDLFFPNLRLDSHQGDRQIVDWARYFNIIATQDAQGISLHFNHAVHSVNATPVFDFTDYPDLAQTVIVLCAAKGMNATFKGLESLRIKETDRIQALQNELLKYGLRLKEVERGHFRLFGRFVFSHQSISTYDDHRMAMAFAPLALLGDITIEGPEVVEKSYPGFWSEMQKAGFRIR